MAGGNVDKVVDALIAASKAGIELTYSIATAIDLAVEMYCQQFKQAYIQSN